ncbi:MAG: hypothetical protein WHS46_13455 [Desulfosoma sp.]
MRKIPPLVPVQAPVLAAHKRLGTFEHNLDIPPIIAWVAAVIILDGVIHLHHVQTHAVPSLWRLHVVHHADLDIPAPAFIRWKSCSPRDSRPPP